MKLEFWKIKKIDSRKETSNMNCNNKMEMKREFGKRSMDSGNVIYI